MNRDFSALLTNGTFSRRRLILYGLIGIGTLFAISLASTYVLLSTTYDFGISTETDTKPEVHSYNSGTSETAPISNIAGTLLALRSTSTLLYKTATAETIVNNTFGFLPFSNLTVALKDPPKSQKVSSGGLSCPLIIESRAYSYSCDQPTTLVKHAGLGQHATVGEFRALYAAARYKQGFLVQQYSQAGAQGRGVQYHNLAYVSPDRPVVTKRLSNQLFDPSQYQEIITDRTNPRSSAFVAFNHATGKGRYYASFESAEGKEFERQHKLSEQEQSTCTLVGTRLTCYHGPYGDPSHEVEFESREVNLDSDTEAANTPAKGVIEVTDFTAAQASTTSYQGPDDYSVNSLYSSAAGTIFSHHGHELDRIEFGEDTFAPAPVNENIKVAAGGENLIFIHDNKLYEYDDASRQSLLLYKDPNEELHDVSVYGNQVLSLSYNRKDPAQLLNVYRIEDLE